MVKVCKSKYHCGKEKVSKSAKRSKMTQIIANKMAKAE